MNFHIRTILDSSQYSCIQIQENGCWYSTKITVLLNKCTKKFHGPERQRKAKKVSHIKGY